MDCGDFPGSPVVKTHMGSIPGWGTKTPHAVRSNGWTMKVMLQISVTPFTCWVRLWLYPLLRVCNQGRFTMRTVTVPWKTVQPGYGRWTAQKPLLRFTEIWCISLPLTRKRLQRRSQKDLDKDRACVITPWRITRCSCLFVLVYFCFGHVATTCYIVLLEIILPIIVISLISVKPKHTFRLTEYTWNCLPGLYQDSRRTCRF